MPEKSCQITVKFSRKSEKELIIIGWLESLEKKHINKSAMIKEILFNHIEGGSIEERLDRIEAMLNNGQISVTAQDVVKDDFFDDMILDNLDL